MNKYKANPSVQIQKSKDGKKGWVSCARLSTSRSGNNPPSGNGTDVKSWIAMSIPANIETYLKILILKNNSAINNTKRIII